MSEITKKLRAFYDRTYTLFLEILEFKRDIVLNAEKLPKKYNDLSDYISELRGEHLWTDFLQNDIYRSDWSNMTSKELKAAKYCNSQLLRAYDDLKTLLNKISFDCITREEFANAIENITSALDYMALELFGKSIAMRRHDKAPGIEPDLNSNKNPHREVEHFLLDKFRYIAGKENSIHEPLTPEYYIKNFS